MEIEYQNMKIKICERTLKIEIRYNETFWKSDSSYNPYFIENKQKYYLNEADIINHNKWENAIGIGIDTYFSGFGNFEKNYELMTRVWIEKNDKNVIFELIPIKEDEKISEICWPCHFEFEKKSQNWYTLINVQQGLLLPNTWENEFGMPFFDGQFCTSASYMPWYAQIKDGQGYLAICEQPWDAFYYVDHPAGGPYTHIGVRWVPSLGLMRYKRCIRMIFQENTDYTKICKKYKQYIKEQGKFITLKEKRIKLDVDKLVGAAIIHEGIKTSIANTSIFYDKNNIQNNYSLTTFEERKEEIINYSKLGLEKAYVHLDGWMQDGYDNKHPDALEACKEAGGWDAFRDFIKTLHDLGYAGGIHDQYRDFYFDAKSFSKEFACQNSDGNITVHQLWAGGKQSYLCASQVLPFVKRNYKNLEEHQIDLDGTYIDVFNCNEGDECYNYKHKMSRKECLDYRMQIFYYLVSKGILTSSEEVTDWSLPGVVFAHYAPYNFMMYDQKAARNGIPVPLFNLVYHECVIIPWMMEKYKDEDYMLYALINGGIPYLKRESSYPNMDGCFGNDENLSLKERIKRCKIVMDLHKKVVYKELIKHEFIDNDYKKQKSVFSDGTEVEIDLNTNRFYIK